MKKLVTAVCLFVSSAAPANECRSLAAVEWLLGDWTTAESNVVIQESWRRVSGRTFEGESITKRLPDRDLVAHETLRLVAMSDGVFYIAKVPENDLPVPFRLTQCTEGVLVFENPLHDAPRHLTYKHLDAAAAGAPELEVRVGGGRMEDFSLFFHRL